MQRAIEAVGIPTCLIAAIPQVCRQQGKPRAVDPKVTMGANEGEPNNAKMQTEIVKEALKHIVEADMPGIIKPLPQVYHAKI